MRIIGSLLLAALCASAQYHRSGIPAVTTAPTPPMGWNSYQRFGVTVTEQIVRDSAAALVANGLAAKGYAYINLDDGWMHYDRDASGNLQTDSRYFPSGIQALSDYIHGLGLKFGIYASGGTRTCAGYAGSKGYEYKDAAQFADWGADYLKWDISCNLVPLDIPTVRQSHERMSRAVHSTGRDMLFTGGGGGLDFPKWFASVGNSSTRTTGDIATTWESMSSIGFDGNTGVAEFGGPNHWLDLDFLIVGMGLTEDEDKTQFSLWALQAAPLIIGADVRSLNASALAILGNEDVIAVDQDALGIVGKKASSVVCGGATCEIWAKPLSGGACAIGAFNRDTDPHDITITFADVAAVFPACGSGPYTTTKNLWTGANPGTLTTNYTATAVPAHGVTLIRVAP